ncbi:hypothetical protein EB796_012572 [Bugula neritina]|uniref:Uncharacterized protein n=1 Tax=Bugula neritina TaxID=10212 RepID=A0A7J7JTY4_BUGNE|nr:hypothetical protein EB796_012572 [Bugula neritina]
MLCMDNVYFFEDSTMEKAYPAITRVHYKKCILNLMVAIDNSGAIRMGMAARYWFNRFYSVMGLRADNTRSAGTFS